ncbi:hypothetical protein GPECTOR_6g714 [Gonium pectorale]|uniref:Uncharacterized protein n=1 Tax=Gonium pectorale TaxID=33097 RepID=A0A150GV90_GONPE|nr:hypothetical protein GPECTOR_6g714 [Gonium pectorale]|eukprot:KXZ53796.1 hypothetical protein GPECTOR_6g714 [Gonium pectorale]
MNMLELFFRPSKQESWTLAEVSDFNFHEEDEDDGHAAHMYTSHLADRLAMQPIGPDVQ